MKIKICGITNLPDAEYALDSGADLIGFVFYPPSPRYIVPDAAAEIIARLPPTAVTVGVFVNESVESMARTIRAAGLKMAQLHGQESLEEIEQLRATQAIAATAIIKAVSLGTELDLERARQFAANLVLIDTPSDRHGGTGVTGDWGLAKWVAESQRILLAGGLTPDNVATAIRAVRPYGVDVSTGVELTPGQKDPKKVRAFIQAARNAEDR